GSDRNLDQIKRSLQIEEGETTTDRQFSLETVNCLGTCALAPVVMVEEDYYDEVKPGRIEKILLNYHSDGEG
ncbi:MAG: NAD(P)H-dependent oxidoreductase subunit E, partial [Desulfobacterales bacterium]|nr:NAD(P)H-dependent oxidoreductase subunit E [Desulfobacterales bacterium]